MPRRRNFETSLIKSVSDVSPGDLIYTANEHPTVHLIVRIDEDNDAAPHLRLFTFVVLSSGTSKMYDLRESYIWLLKMQKIVFKS